MKSLVLYTSTDRKGKHDATGAFIPEAEAFQELHAVDNADMIPISQHLTKGERRYITKSALTKGVFNGEYNAIVYFGHGTTRGLPGLGYSLGAKGYDHIALAKLLSWALTPNGKVVLYACLAGKGFGFADRLAVELRKYDRWAEVISHLTSGHTSINPRAEYSGRGPDHVGQNIINKKNTWLWKEWRRRLRIDQKFRLTFPFMTKGKIENELLGFDTGIEPMLLPERP